MERRRSYYELQVKNNRQWRSLQYGASIGRQSTISRPTRTHITVHPSKAETMAHLKVYMPI
eukprot:scaffold150852_cov58-Attheya_sp.AAC.1